MAESYEENLRRLARARGIAEGYENVQGEHIVPRNEDLIAVLEAMGTPASSAEEVDRALEKLREEEERRLFPRPVLVLSPSEPPRFPFRLPRGAEPEDYRLLLHTERGERIEWDGKLFSRRDAIKNEESLFDSSAFDYYEATASRGIPEGMHRLKLQEKRADTDPAREEECLLLIRPERCYIDPEIEKGKRLGLSVQLYALRSRRNAGVGDFADLETLITELRPRGFDVFGLNPLHCLFTAHPEHISPYSPSSRFFLNPAYIALERVPDWAECDRARALHDSAEFQDVLQREKEEKIINYPLILEKKQELLKLLFQSFLENHRDENTRRYRSFRAYLKIGGEKLQRHVLHEAAYEYFKRSAELYGIRQWPEEFHDPDSEASRAFARENPEWLLYYAYLQWNASLQFRAANRHARRNGALLYLDLAVGAEPGGSEAWEAGHVYSSRASSGAPPDPFAPQGQDWGLATPIPAAMREERYEHFRELLHANMPHGGIVRMDHAMQLQRIYWTIRSGDASRGAYVNYPLEELLAVLAQESARRRCTFIGEDLGTLPPGFSEQTRRNGIFSWKVLYFEKWGAGNFRPPEECPPYAAAAINTHDLPTLAGYRRGNDIRAREDIGIFTPEESERQFQERETDIAALRAMARERGAAPPVDEASGDSRDFGGSGGSGEEEDDFAFFSEFHRLLFSSGGLLKIASLHDLLGETEQPNLPGTTSEYPNWSLRYPGVMEEWPNDRLLQRRLGELEALREELSRR